MDQKVSGKLGPALFVFYFQLQVHSWLKEQWHFNNNANYVPDCMQCFQEINGLQMSWLPGFKSIPALATLAATSAPSPVIAAAAPNAAWPGGPAPHNDAAVAIPNQLQNPNRDMRQHHLHCSIHNTIRTTGSDAPAAMRDRAIMSKETYTATCTHQVDHFKTRNAKQVALFDWSLGHWQATICTHCRWACNHCCIREIIGFQ